MSRVRNEKVASYVINKTRVDVIMCWSGADPSADSDCFYDLYTQNGKCLNEGTPWFDDGDGVPSKEDILDVFQDYFLSRYTYDIDFVFRLTTDFEPEELLKEENVHLVIEAAKKRLAEIEKAKDGQAFEVFDAYENIEEE